MIRTFEIALAKAQSGTVVLLGNGEDDKYPGAKKFWGGAIGIDFDGKLAGGEPVVTINSFTDENGFIFRWGGDIPGQIFQAVREAIYKGGSIYGALETAWAEENSVRYDSGGANNPDGHFTEAA